MVVSCLVSEAYEANFSIATHEFNIQVFEIAYGFLAAAIGASGWLVFERPMGAILFSLAASAIFIASSPLLAIYLGLMVAGLLI